MPNPAAAAATTNNSENHTTEGKFTKEETELIQHAIETYCHNHQTSSHQLCSGDTDFRSEEHRGAWNEIARILPHRTVASIYRAGLRIMHPFKRGAWSKEEMIRLNGLVSVHGKRWAMIQSELNRSAESCRDKHRDYGLAYKRGKWMEDESQLLETFVREHVIDERNRIKKKNKEKTSYEEQEEREEENGNRSMGQIDNMIASKQVTVKWGDISKKIGTRSRLACYKRFLYLVGQSNKNAIKNNTSNNVDDDGKGEKENNKNDHHQDRSQGIQKPAKRKKRKKQTSESPLLPSPISPTTQKDQTLSLSTGHEKRSKKARSNTTSINARNTSGNAVKEHHRHRPTASITPNPILPDATSTTNANNNIRLNNNNSSNDKNDKSYIHTAMTDEDMIRTIASSTSCLSIDDLMWENNTVQKRWENIVNDFLENIDNEEEKDDIMNQPMWEIAKCIYQNEEEQAEIAARTVEAVFTF